ncbi:unnamed protein product [Orchesella dallaii]|uniref:G-protein coupled receptors family 1 profile domain-containing protein n=1 Tax=Orchesella dallaii TaxID=48710 RepID=A0ABP1QGV7_9HEXA
MISANTSKAIFHMNMEDYEEEFADTSVYEGSVIFTATSSFPLFVANFTSTATDGYENYNNFSNDKLLTTHELPRDLSEIRESSKHCIIAYCILFVIATTGNLTVLVSVFQQYKKTKTRISLLILHLSIADLIVCCTLIPIEVFWRLTIQWRGGNELCKLMQFVRAFGLYLSSMVLICVSFDRFFAILFPLRTLRRQGHQRIKIMLWIAWVASAAFSAPQAILFSIQTHPNFPSFKQCVTDDSEIVRMYSIFSVSAMYFAPLVVILFTYSAILIKIIRKAHQNSDPIPTDEQQQQLHQRNRQSIRFRMSIRNSSGQRSANTSINNCTTPITHNHSKLSATNCRHKTGDQGEFSSEEGSFTGSTCSTMNVTSLTTASVGSTRYCHSPSPDVLALGRVNSHRAPQVVLRRSENAASTMSRAKHRTLVMTIVIVIVFVLCWTPYAVMTLWYMFDWKGAEGVDSGVQEWLFIMAVANSCVNPLIYGSFAKNCCGLSKIFSRLRRTCGQ